MTLTEVAKRRAGCSGFAVKYHALIALGSYDVGRWSRTEKNEGFKKVVGRRDEGGVGMLKA